MFEQLHKPLVIPRWAAFCVIVGGAFSLGIFAGKLLAGARPFDWTSDILNTLFTLGITIWCTLRAIKSDD
jgi:hypothetical protein